MTAREKKWKPVSRGECLHCGGAVEVFTDLEGEKAYESDKARCSECGCPASVVIDESMDAPDGDDGAAYLNWHDEECDCVWCKQQAIVEALRNENAVLKKSLTIPDNHVRGPDGVDRRVLGTLPMTKDGAVVGSGPDAIAYLESGLQVRPYLFMAEDPAPIEFDPSWYAEDCYSTREAALSARTGKDGERSATPDTDRYGPLA